MGEESYCLTRTEAEFCRRISRLTARVMKGSDLAGKMEEVCRRLDAELLRQTGLIIPLNMEEKNVLSLAAAAYELLLKGEYKVLEKNFDLQGMPVSEEEIRESAAAVSSFVKERNLDLPALRKKTRYRRNVPSRKLYIADLHFFDESLNSRMDMRGFSGYEEMNARMIRQWNEYVTQKDEIYVLGDFSVSKGAEANEILRKLNGKIFLIEGNHDCFLSDKEFDRSLVEWVRPYAEIRDFKRRVILSHYPVFCYKGQYGPRPTYMLYGHVHNSHDEKLVNEFIRISRETMVTSKYHQHAHPIPCNMINCFCVFSDYVPLTLDDWIGLDERRREKMTFELKRE